MVKEGLRSRPSLILAGLILVGIGTIAAIGQQGGAPAGAQTGGEAGGEKAGGLAPEAAYEVTNQTPSAPGNGVFAETFSSKVSSEDGVLFTTALSNVDGGWDGQVYKFPVHSVEGVGRITVHWVGYGESTAGFPVTAEIYNFKAEPPAWELAKSVQTSQVGQNVSLDLDLVDSFESYLDGEGNLWVRVRALNQELAAPTNVAASAVASSEVRLSWEDNATSETGYHVSRQEVGGVATSVVTLPANSTAYTDYDSAYSAPAPGKKYIYSVSAIAGSSASLVGTSPQVTMPLKGKRNSATINVPANAATIQEGLNLAQANDTVQVAAGTYAEAAVVRTPKVTLAGAGVSATTIDVPSNCRAEFCAPVSVVTNSSQVSTVRDLGTSDGSGTLRNGVRYGGGVYVYNSAADLRRLKLFRASMAAPGGMGSAIALVKPDVVTVDNVAAMLNLADGPVVYLEDANKGVVLKHVTLSGNGSSGAKPAAGIWAQGSSGSMDVVNSVLWANTSGQDEVASDSSSAAIRVAHSIIGPLPGPVGGPITTEGAQGPQLVSTLNANPLLTSYQDPHLLEGSPAIDIADAGSVTSYDYENLSRPSGSGYDVGASEYVDPKSGGDKKVEAVGVSPQLVLVRPAPRPHASLNTDAIYLVIESATPPAAPSNLRIAAVTEDRISIRFLDNATDEDGFTVHRVLGGLDQLLSPIAANPGTGDVLYPDYGADLPSGRLAPGTTYCYYVSAYRGSVSADSPQICQATQGEAGSPPAAPSNVAAEGISAGQIRLTWTDNSSNEDGFVLYRKRQGDGSDFSIVSPPAVANAASYVDSGGDTDEGILQSGETYCYRVAAYNVHGLSSAVPSNPDGVCTATPLQTWVEVFEGAGDGSNNPTLGDLGERSEFQFQDENDSVELETDFAELLGQPDVYNWQVFAVHLDTPPAGLTSLTLRWRGRGEDQVDYPVRFSLYNFSSGTWTHQPVFPGGEVEGDVRPEGGALPNSLYTFTLTSQQLASAFAGTAAGYPNTLLLWVRARAYIPTPEPPENLRAYPDPAPTTVYLAWDDRSATETGFEVQRAPVVTAPVPVEPSWSTVRITAANVTTYSESVLPASTYLYRVRAVRGAIASGFTSEVAVLSPLYPPYLPNVVPSGPYAIQVNWQMNPSNGAKFPVGSYTTQVYRAAGTNPFPQDWQLVGTATDGALTYLDSGLDPDTTYSYYLRFAVPDGGSTRYSVDSEHVYTKTTALGVPPAPADLEAEAVSTSQINLGWKDVDGELAYDLERQTGLTGVWQTVDANIPPDEISYGDVGLTPGQLYRYRIRAKNAAGFSNYSNEAQATTVPASGEQWQAISQIPSRSGLVQGATVLAAHGGYLYAASNDAENQGKEGWFHLNVWRSTDGGVGDPWQWVGQTTTNISGNVPAAMVSFNGKLFLLTGSRLWSGTGATWSEALSQGVGDAASNGYFSHLTVYGGKLYVLVQDGSVYSSADGSTWTKLDAAPAGVNALAQYGGFLVAAVDITPRGGEAAQRELYRSSNGTQWEPLGTLVGEDGFGRCDSYVGLLGLGSNIYSGASDASSQPCLWRSPSGQSWARVGGAVNLWAALPDASAAYVATTAQYPEPLAAKIDAATGSIELLGTQGLGVDYRIWSLAAFNGSRYGVAFPSVGASPAVPPPPVILLLGSS